MNRESLSYWLQVRSSEPATIRDPAQYDGASSLSIACTQTDLPASAQAKLVQRWCEFLPSLANVDRVWFRSQVPQRLFESAVAMPAITGLWVKWSSIKSLDCLADAKGLTHLHLGGSAQVQSLAPLASLPQLIWLTLENTKQVQDLDAIGRMPWLRGLGYSGGIWGKPEVNTLEPLSHLKNLTWLNISSLRVRDGSLRPLAELHSLQEIIVPNYYALEEYAFLRGRLPQLAPDLQPFYSLAGLGLKCRKCRDVALVAPLGRGTRNLCPACDAAALAAHCSAFDNLTRQHSAPTAV